jgi:hypothetical protein
VEGLVDFDSAIYPSYEGVRCQEADGAGQEAIDQTGQEAVSKEQHGRHETSDVEMVRVVVDAVEEDPYAGRAAQEEGLPPPVVVLPCVSECFSMLQNPVETHTSEQSWI